MSITKTELLKLQNGSDVRGIACEGIAEEHITLTPEAAYLIGQAFAIWLLKKKKYFAGAMYYRHWYRFPHHRTGTQETGDQGHACSGHLRLRLRYGIHPRHVHVHCIPGDSI